MKTYDHSSSVITLLRSNTLVECVCCCDVHVMCFFTLPKDHACLLLCALKALPVTWDNNICVLFAFPCTLLDNTSHAH